MNEKIIDLYPFLEVKRGNNTLYRNSVSYSWVPTSHRRRLEAYVVLSAYTANLSNFVRGVPESEGLSEFGDANYICEVMSSTVCGDSLRIVSPGKPEIERWFSQWATDDLFFAHVVANEYKASNLGDCVFRLRFSKRLNRVQVSTLDPGFWFPFNLGTKDERHIIAWEEEHEKYGKVVYKEEYAVGQDDKSRTGKNSVHITAGYYERKNSPRLDDLKLVAFAEDDDGRKLDKADLGVDFFPLIYIPNIYREGWDFGQSDLTAVVTLLDELANVDSDTAKNSRALGLGQLWMEPKTFETLPVNTDGEKVVKMGQNNIIPGRAGVVDNSNLNKALHDTNEKLNDRLARNTFLGPLFMNAKTGSGDRTTGIFLMKGGPIERFIGGKRLVREPKYAKLLKYVAKLTLKHSKDGEAVGVFGKDGEFTNTARLLFGNILPIDQEALVGSVQKVRDRLAKEDLRDNLREAGLTVNEEILDPPLNKPAGDA